MDTRKHIVDLEAFREMFHISPKVPGQSFAELPFEEEILEFLQFLGHSAQIKTLTDVNVNKLFQLWRSFAVVINKCLTGKSSGIDSLRDDILFSTIKVVSRHQNTQQYSVILPIELTTEDIRNTKAYKEYYACATGEAAPKPKASARRKRGGSASYTTPPTPIATLTPITTVVATPRLSAAAKGKQLARATSPTDPSDVERTEAKQLKIVLRKSRQETHISQHGGFSTDEGTSFKPGVPDVPSDDSDEEISWNSSDDEDVDAQGKDRDDDEGKKIDEKTKSDGESKEEETTEKEEESFDPIPRTPKESEDDGNGEEDQGLRISEEERMHEEEEADELYRDVDINQGRGLQVSQDIEDSHVTLTPVHSDGQQESSSTDIVQTLLTLALVFCFEDRVKSLEVNFSEFMRTNQSPEAVSNISGRLQDSIQRENDKFLRTIDDNMKKIIKEQPRKPPTPDRDWNKSLPAAQGNAQSCISTLVKQTDARSSFNELLDTLIDFSNFIMNRLGVDTLTPELLAGPTYKLMRGSCNSLTELEYHLEEVYKATTDQLDWVNPEGQQCPHNLLQPLPLIPNNRGRRVIPFEHFINKDLEYLWGGDFKRLHLQDIEDMLLLLVQGKLSNLTVEERFAFNVSLRMFTRSIVIQRRVKDLQLGVESYQKRLNLTKPDTYRSDLKRREAYTAYSNPRGFIYQNKDKKNRLMRIDELQKFSDGTLNDVRNALDDRLKGIRIQYLPTTIQRKGDKDRAAAMIQAIDKMLKTRRIMRSLERFIGGRQYEGDFQMLQRTIGFIE
nr:hypothetical protein [Tanacetum cinerariifolium]